MQLKHKKHFFAEYGEGAMTDCVKSGLQNFNFFITQEIADILKISKSIKLLLKMKNLSYVIEETKQTSWPTQYIYH